MKLSVLKGLLFSFGLMVPLAWGIAGMVDPNFSATSLLGYGGELGDISLVGWVTFVSCFICGYGVFAAFDFGSNVGKLVMVALCVVSYFMFQSFVLIIGVGLGAIVGFIILKICLSELFSDWEAIPKIVSTVSAIVGLICLVLGGGLFYYMFTEGQAADATFLEYVVMTFIAVSYILTGVACFLTMGVADKQDEIIEAAKLQLLLNFWNPIFWLVRWMY